MDKIIKRTPVISYGTKSKIYACTFQELYTLRNDIVIPEIQGDLNQDKVDEMLESFNNKHHFMGSKCLITIAKIVIGEELQFLLIDGQHRFSMIMEVVENQETCDSILISLIEVNSQQELKDLFEEINNDSAKCIYKNLTIFDKEIYEKLKIKIKEQFPNAPLKSNNKSRVYSIAQFVQMIIEKKVIEKIRLSEEIKDVSHFNVDYIVNLLKSKDKTFLIKCQYKEMYHMKSDNFKKDEITQILNNSSMFIKNNNFIDWLIEPTKTTPTHDFNFRPHIGKTLRKKVWEKQFGSNSNGKCPIFECSKILDINVENSWHCGHIISHFNGGLTELDNLKPICPSCNKTMNYKNWADYEKEIYIQYLDKLYFPDRETTVCRGFEGCKSRISKSNYRPVICDDAKLYPWCNKCYNNYFTNE